MRMDPTTFDVTGSNSYFVGTDSNGDPIYQTIQTTNADNVTVTSGPGYNGLAGTVITQVVSVAAQPTDVTDQQTTVNYDSASQVLTDLNYTLPAGEVLTGVTLTYAISTQVVSFTYGGNPNAIVKANPSTWAEVIEQIKYDIDTNGSVPNTTTDTTPDVDNFLLGNWSQISLLDATIKTLAKNNTYQGAAQAAVVTSSTVTATDVSAYNAAGTFDMSYATKIYDTVSGAGGNGVASYATDTGSQLTITYDYTTPCFVTGAMVLTADGERLIETLAAGDMVVTRLDGVESMQPIRWIGRKDVSRAALRASPMSVAPVRIKAGALGDNSPSQDMLVSPCHGLLIDGLMVQAGALVNGSSVTQEFNAETPFTYYHVELDGHALIVVDNVAAETFLDSVSVMAFDNWRERAEPAVATQSVDELPYPRVTSARQLPRHIRNDLAARAAVNGHDFAVQAA